MKLLSYILVMKSIQLKRRAKLAGLEREIGDLFYEKVKGSFCQGDPPINVKID